MSIFGGVEPPAWLQQIAKPADMTTAAKDIGMGFGGIMIALQDDPNADPIVDPVTGESHQPKKGIQQGLLEARMNQQDPLWKVKEKQMEGQAVNTWASAASRWQEYDTNNRETAAWTTKDLPELYKYRDALKNDPNAPPPIMESTKGTQALSKIQTGLSQGAVAKSSAMAFQKMVEGLVARGGQAAAVGGKYAKAIGAVPSPQVLEQFGKDVAALGLNEEDLITGSKLPVTGITTGPKGTTVKRGFDLRDKLGALEQNLKDAEASGNDALVADIRKQIDKINTSAVDTARARGEEQRTTEGVKHDARTEEIGQRGDIRKEIEQQKATDRQALAQTQQQFKVDLEKMKSELQAKGKTISKGQFLERNFVSVRGQIEKAWNPKTVQEDQDLITNQAMLTIDRAYRMFAPPKAVNSTPATPTAPPADAKDPLNLFQ